jgi:hypothetical protein
MNAPRFHATRIGTGPLIVPNMDDRMGANINGPSLIRVPHWAPNRLGRYYLYFAHHNGAYIRLAYADSLQGPWSVFSPGTLQHAESHFPPALDDIDPARIPLGMVAPIPHIASPDVHVDHAERRFRMYYHGINKDRTQVTRVATSPDGIRFTALPDVVGNPYFRAFRYGGLYYGIAMPGIVYRSADGITGFERGPTLFAPNMRHTALLLRGEVLTVFYTNVGEAPPERILAANIGLRPDWRDWRPSEPAVVLEPELPYEGGDLPLVASIRGEITARARQLRDPAIYEEGESVYLLYSVAGESGIALAELARQWE